MDKLACILLNVNTVYSYFFISDINVSVLTYRTEKLGYLICLRQVGIEIIFAVEGAEIVDFTVLSQSRFYGKLGGTAGE